MGDMFRGIRECRTCNPITTAPSGEGDVEEAINHVKGIAIWLKSALGCKSFVWDGDQAQAAEECLAEEQNIITTIRTLQADKELLLSDKARLEEVLNRLIPMAESDVEYQKMAIITEEDLAEYLENINEAKKLLEQT